MKLQRRLAKERAWIKNDRKRTPSGRTKNRPVSLQKWIAVGKALDKMEKTAPGAGTPETAKQN